MAGQVGKEEGAVGVPFNVTIGGHKGSKLHLWSFDNPYLYDLQVSLHEGSSSNAAVGPSRLVPLPSCSPIKHLIALWRAAWVLNQEF